MNPEECGAVCDDAITVEEDPLSTSLVFYDQAKYALAQARDMDEVKTIRNRAEALRAYTRQQGESLEMQNWCAEIKLRAERRAGELLAEMDKNVGGRPPETEDIMSSVSPPTYEELGIHPKQAQRWQLEASVPEVIFSNT